MHVECISLILGACQVEYGAGLTLFTIHGQDTQAGVVKKEENSTLSHTE